MSTTDRSCDRCLSDGGEDEGEPEVICHPCQDEMVRMFKETGATEAAAAIADWLATATHVHGAGLIDDGGRWLLRGMAEGIRSGAWRSLSTPGAKEPQP